MISLRLVAPNRKDSKEVEVSPSSTLSEVKALAHTSLPQEETADYHDHLLAASYGNDVKVLSFNKHGDQTLEALEIDTQSVLFFRSPHTKLVRRRPDTDEALAEEEKEWPVEEEGEFEGLSVANVLGKLVEKRSERKKKQRDLLWKFIDMNLEDIVTTEAWKRLSPETITTLMARDTLSIPEDALFSALLDWGKVQMTKTRAKTLSEVISPSLLHSVRVPWLNAKTIASLATDSGLFTAEQLLALYTLSAQRLTIEEIDEEKKRPELKIPPVLNVFSTTARKHSGGAWKFDRKDCATNITLSKGDRVITLSTGASQWNTCRVSKWITSGKHKIRYKILNNNSTNWIMLGLIYPGYSQYNDLSSGYIGSNGSNGAGWTSASNGQRYGSTSGTYGNRSPAFRTGETVTCFLDMTARTCRFEIKEVPASKQWGPCFSNIPAKVAFGVTLYNTGESVQIL